jgi:aspartyl-tRNA(Asn)/glutamyl-tRNA(Gln) amidotransferase subunit A
MEPGVDAAVRAGIETLRELGAEIRDVSLPSTDRGLATYYIIAPAEASANLARYDGVKYGLSAGAEELWDNYTHTRGSGFGAEVKRRIMLGTYALSAGYYDAYYVKAQQVRTLIKDEFDAVLNTVDAILAPTSPTVAFKIGAKVDDPLAMYLNDACTLPVNIAGLPGISVPAGLSDGLPVGLQVIGRAFDEATVLRVADAYERSAGHADLRPPTASA